jgi:RNA polymerase sigma-70 factor (ECF subfamily)
MPIALQHYIEHRDNRSFTKLYNEYRPGLLYFIKKRIKDDMLAEEVLSNAFEKVYLKIDTYNNMYSFKTWIYKIASNESGNVLKRESKYVACDFNSNLDSNETYTSDVYEAFDKVNNQQEYDHDIDINESLAKDLMNELDAKHKDIMIDREVNKMSYKDIAEKYDMNENTVKTRIFFGRKKIQKAFGKINEEK